LWHFYEAKSVGSEGDWNELLQNKVSQPSVVIEGNVYHRVWSGAGESSPPVAMTETTFAESGNKDRTDQFAMLYQRELENGLFEYVLQAAEEKLVDGRLDRSLVISTGIDLNVADITIIG
jgi:hypothetical protein